MKTADQKLLLTVVFATAACFPALPQTRFSPAVPGVASTGSTITSHSGAGYVSGGERGSVVQVVRDAEVQAELNLSQEQRQQITDILLRVQATEEELFEDFRRHEQAQLEAARTRWEQHKAKLGEAHRQLATATKKILALLTPVQQQQLQAFCRQSAADEAGSRPGCPRISVVVAAVALVVVAADSGELGRARLLPRKFSGVLSPASCNAQ